MECERCNSAQATIHLMKETNDHKTHLHLCKDCAEELDESDGQAGVSISNILSKLLDEDPEESLTCERCGLDLATFRSRGRVGCPACYETFEDQLSSLIKRIHGAREHVSGSGGELGVLPTKRKQKLLEKKLKEAVEEERYEDAAQLRDRIDELEESTHESSV